MFIQETLLQSLPVPRGNDSTGICHHNGFCLVFGHYISRIDFFFLIYFARYYSFEFYEFFSVAVSLLLYSFLIT